MAKQEAKLANSFLPYKESKTSRQSYYYIRVPTIDSEQPPYVVIPLCHSKPRRLRKCISCKCYCFNLLLLLGILFLVALGFILWLSQPKLNVVHVHLNHMNISSQDAVVFLDTSMDLEVKIQNQEYLIPYSYNLVSIFIGYQGVWLQPTMTNERFINTGGISYFEATVGLNRTQALETSLEPHGGHNIKEGFVSLDIVIEVGANYRFLYVYVPLQARISCSINVDTENQTIANQNCYPLHDMIMDVPIV